MMLLLALAARADTPVLLPDARFALALYCNPTCDDKVLDALDSDLAGIESVEGFSDFQTKPSRIMGIAGTDFGIPDADFIEEYGHDVDSPEALAKSQQVILAWFAGPRADAVETFAIAHAAFARAAKNAHGWVEDLDTQAVYGAIAWADSDPRGDMEDWYVIDGQLMDDNAPEGNQRLLTRGLRRYGDIELVAEDVPPDHAEDVSLVVAAVARAIERNGDVAASMPIDEDGVKGTATLTSLESRRDDDPESPIARLRFDGKITPAGEPDAEPAPAVASIRTPPAPAPVPVATPPAGAPAAPTSLIEARSLVQAQVAGRLREAFSAGLPKGDVLALDVPFPAKNGSHEYLWLEVESWSGDTITGTLKTQPTLVVGLNAGDKVSVRGSDVFDYVWKHADGSREGNVTKGLVR